MNFIRRLSQGGSGDEDSGNSFFSNVVAKKNGLLNNISSKIETVGARMMKTSSSSYDSSGENSPVFAPTPPPIEKTRDQLFPEKEPDAKSETSSLYANVHVDYGRRRRGSSSGYSDSSGGQLDDNNTNVNISFDEPLYSPSSNAKFQYEKTGNIAANVPGIPETYVAQNENVYNQETVADVHNHQQPRDRDSNVTFQYEKTGSDVSNDKDSFPREYIQAGYDQNGENSYSDTFKYSNDTDTDTDTQPSYQHSPTHEYYSNTQSANDYHSNTQSETHGNYSNAHSANNYQFSEYSNRNAHSENMDREHVFETDYQYSDDLERNAYTESIIKNAFPDNSERKVIAAPVINSGGSSPTGSDKSTPSDSSSKRSGSRQKPPKLTAKRRSSTVDEMLFDDYISPEPEVEEIKDQVGTLQSRGKKSLVQMGDLMSFDDDKEKENESSLTKEDKNTLNRESSHQSKGQGRLRSINNTNAPKRNSKNSPYRSVNSNDSREFGFGQVSVESSENDFGGYPVRNRTTSMGSETSWSSSYSIESQPDDVTRDCMEFMKEFVDKIFNSQ